MVTEKELALAKDVFQRICNMLDAKNWHYDKEEEMNAIHFAVTGEILPMQVIVFVDAERQLVRVMSPLECKFPENRRLDGALAICHVNYLLADGNFDYDYTDGTVMFKCTTSFLDSLISVEALEYMVNLVLCTVDSYNGRLMSLAKGEITIDKFKSNKLFDL